MATPIAMPSGIDLLLETEQKRLREVRDQVEQIDPSRSFMETVLDNMGSVNLIFSNFVLERIVESQPGGRSNVQMLVLLVQVMLLWGIVNWAIKRWIVWIGVSNRVFASAMALFLADITSILTFINIQYALSIFTQLSREGSLTLAESLVVALIMKLALSAMTAIINVSSQLSKQFRLHKE